MSGEQPKDRIGIDLGGTKIEAIVMDGQGQQWASISMILYTYRPMS